MSKTKGEPAGSMLPLPLRFLAAWLAVWLGRVLQQEVDYLMAENRVLRERLGNKRLRLTVAERRRLAVLGERMGRKALAKVATIARPETILRWYRELVAKKYDGSKKRGPGRPRKRGEIAELVVKMARENEGWGYTRIKGALQNLGYKVGRGTIQRILRGNGIDPAPLRGMPWGTFIKAHLGAIVGMDFLTVEVVTLLGLVRYHVLFVIDIESRRVEIAGIGRDPCGRWMEQMSRNLVDAVDGFLVGKRFVHSIKSECLERMVPLGEGHLRRAILEYMAHYHGERNHQGLGNAPINGAGDDSVEAGPVVRRDRIGGLLHFDHRRVCASVQAE